MAELTDDITATIARAAAGDSAAAWKLFSPHGTALLAYIERHFPPQLRPDLEPQDLLQDVLFHACRRIGQFRPQGDNALWRWLATIARNLLTNALRHRQVTRRADLGDGDESLAAMLEELSVYRRTPSRSAIAHEMIGVLERSLARLPDDYRTVLQLRYLEGLDVEAAAERMTRTADALRMLCCRALKALRTEMRSESLPA